MKAERRHELQENTLAKVITKAPSFWQEFGGRALLIAVAVLAVGLLIRYRISSSRAAESAARDNLNTARDTILQLQQSAMTPMPPQELASRRRTLFSDASQAIDQVSDLADDSTLQAEALVAKGDLNWTVANMPELPGAATQPALQLSRDPKELLKNAQEAYQTVLSKHSDQPHAAIAALFGLAAIAENRGEWDAARKHYEMIASTPNVAQPYLEQARIRLQKLPDLQQPVTIAKPTTMPDFAALAGASSTQPSGPLPPTIAAPAAATRSVTQPTPPGIAPPPIKPPATAPKPSPTTAPAATAPAR